MDAEKNNQYINFLALAQHYELNTNLIDITSDIAVAAFFAVNEYDKLKNEYKVLEKGIGVIKVCSSLFGVDRSFEFIGYQIFKSS
ncbi:FRG domain-containing protein [Cetobacterium somerae]|uniref:FRG domain-containing protein n=1 Tax=Cetobacterium somerae TaxID=188913 RepID=UPI00248D7F45|nr:FRG domain-containing protein [Cetobacterium somerae]